MIVESSTILTEENKQLSDEAVAQLQHSHVNDEGWFRRRKKGETTHIKKDLRDEFNGQVGLRVTVEQPIILEDLDEKGNLVSADHTESCQRDFDYYSETHEPIMADEKVTRQVIELFDQGTSWQEILSQVQDWNCHLVDVLQACIDIRVRSEDTRGKKIRLILLAKGVEPENLVYPDGSIFTSQSRFNLCRSFDEVVAAVMHEVDHILNGTVEAAFKRQAKSQGILGVKWLHEGAADLRVPEGLVALRLKSTAYADSLQHLAEFWGNHRGLEHQAPLVRAVQQLGVHAILDFDSSHLPYTKLPPEFTPHPEMSNLEAIFDAVTKNDTQAVAEYVRRLHPRDFGDFFVRADISNYFGLGDSHPHRQTTEEVARLVGQVVVERLEEQGLTNERIKLFFLIVTRQFSHLNPVFEDLSELTALVPLAQTTFEDGELNSMAQLLFGREFTSDSLRTIIENFNYFCDRFRNKESVQGKDIEAFTNFFQSAFNQIKDKLPTLQLPRSTYFVDERGNYLGWSECREVGLYDRLSYILFNYIEKFFIANQRDGKIDEDELIQLFQTLLNKGYQPLISSASFPLDNVSDQNQRIINRAYFAVFQIELVLSNLSEGAALPPPDIFAQQVKGLDPSSLEKKVASLKQEHELSEEEYRVYVDLGLQSLEEYDFFNSRLNTLLRERIGYEDFMSWRDTGDPKYNSFSQRLGRESAQRNGREVSPPRTLSVDDVIAEYGLDREALYAEASTQAVYDRTQFEIHFVCQTCTSSDILFLTYAKRVMEMSQLNLATLDQVTLLALCRKLFVYANEEHTTIALGPRLKDFSGFYELPYIQEIARRVEQVRFSTLQELLLYFREQRKALIGNPTYVQLDLYEEDVCSVMLGEPFRSEFRRLTDPTQLSPTDYPTLIELLQKEFPWSPKIAEIVRKLQQDFLKDPTVAVGDKITFFVNHHADLGPTAAVIVADYITDVDTYQFFRAELRHLGSDYLSGEKDIDGLATADIATSRLISRADLLVKSVSDRDKDSRELSTDFALIWVQTYLSQADHFDSSIQYDPISKKFILSGLGRKAFASMEDLILTLRQMPETQRVALALKAMTDENGLLTNPEGRRLLERMLNEGLELRDPFLRAVLAHAIREGDAKIIGLPSAQMLAPFLFRGLQTRQVNVKRIRSEDAFKRVDGALTRVKIEKEAYSSDIPRILTSTTDDLRFFGYRYHFQPNSVLGRQAQQSAADYYATIDNLERYVTASQELQKPSRVSDLDPTTEAIIKAGETSPIFVRGMQMAVQLLSFEPALQERLADTQDSMKGMDKLRFWENLVSRAERDSAQGDDELLELLKQIKLGDYLGGGSLFTTYAAVLIGEDGQERKIVIKMLNPNAEQFINLSHAFSGKTLREVEGSSRGKNRRHARLARSLLDLATEWCILDINDPDYLQADNAFRQTIAAYNSSRNTGHVSVPERVYTSKKVKVEDQSSGKTLNKFLGDAEIDSDRKNQVVQNLTAFFDFQFEFSPLRGEGGEQLYFFHSDPHAGNYMKELTDPSADLGVIDRSMYLMFSQQDVEMFTLFKDGNHAAFINQFLTRCLELSEVGGSEAQRVRLRVMNQLGGESLRQTLRRNKNTSAYLQIILQEFANYGERYSFLETGAAPSLSPIERVIIEYFKSNPGTDCLVAYERLSKRLGSLSPTMKGMNYEAFRTLLSDLEARKILKKKIITVPVNFRLMIRNIVAMQNLRQKWAS